MAACGSLQRIFEKPLPETPTLFETLSSWNKITAMKSIDDSSFTELFGELHFKENNHVESSSSSPLPLSSRTSSLSSSCSFLDAYSQAGIERLNKDNNDSINKCPTSSYCPSSQAKHHRDSDSFSSKNSESLSLCTEGLGFESSDDVEDLMNDKSLDLQQREEKSSITRHRQPENSYSEHKRSRVCRGSFPPPISCIARNGKPWVYFKSYRQDGRFILKEIRIPTQEFLHACREDGRLKLQFIQSDDEMVEEEEEEEEEEEDEEVNDDLENLKEADEGKGEDVDDGKHEKIADEEQKDAEKGVQIISNNVLDDPQ